MFNVPACEHLKILSSASYHFHDADEAWLEKHMETGHVYDDWQKIEEFGRSDNKRRTISIRSCQVQAAQLSMTNIAKGMSQLKQPALQRITTHTITVSVNCSPVGGLITIATLPVACPVIKRFTAPRTSASSKA